MKMSRRSREHLNRLGAGEHAGVGERIDAFDFEFTHRFVAHAAVGPVGMGFDLAGEPVDGRIARLA